MKRALLLFVASAALLWSVPLSGHHPLSEYDETRVTTIDGTLSEIRIKNPHSLLTIQVRGADGSTISWTVEWLAALVLRHEGIEHTTLQPGDRVIVTGNPSRDPNLHRLWLRTVTRPLDGWTWTGRF